jgi:hypothetical protein
MTRMAKFGAPSFFEISQRIVACIDAKWGSSSVTCE